MVGAPLTQSVDSFWYLNVALYVFMIVLIFFFGPETKFSRVDVPESEIEDDKVTNEHADVVERHVDTHLGKGKPSRQQFMPWQPFSGSLKSLMHDVVTPFYLMLFPIGACRLWPSAAATLMMTLRDSRVDFVQRQLGLVLLLVCQLDHVGRLWRATLQLGLERCKHAVETLSSDTDQGAQVGLSGLAILVGAFLGFATAGPCGDFVCKILTRRNNGIREPEQRLWALLPFCVILTIGSVVVSLGYDNKWPWQVIVRVYAALAVRALTPPSAGLCRLCGTRVASGRHSTALYCLVRHLRPKPH